MGCDRLFCGCSVYIGVPVSLLLSPSKELNLNLGIHDHKGEVHSQITSFI